MRKKSLGLSLLFLFFCIYAFAEDSITITTYYPSPYGSYNQLEVYRGVTYKPLTDTPSTDLREGELVYVDNAPSDSTPGQFYYYGGGAWAALGGGTAVMNLSCPWVYGGAGALGVTSCTPPSCPAGWTEVSTYNSVAGVTMAYASSTNSFYYSTAGNSVRVCVK